jgi:hypothetical protein
VGRPATHFEEAEGAPEDSDFEVVPIEPADAAASAAEAASPTADHANTHFTSPDGRELRVSFAVDPVLDLKAWAMAGHRIESRIVEVKTGAELTGPQRRTLLPRDFEMIDLAALERGMSRLKGAEIPNKPKLIIQLSFASLANGRGRTALLDRARRLQEVMSQAAICELVDVESGVPLSRLTEVVSLLKHYFRFVVVQIAPRRDGVEAAIAAKASGLTVDASELGEGPVAIAAGMREVFALIKGQRTVLMATSLPTNDLLIDAMSVGFSHATLRAERPG